MDVVLGNLLQLVDLGYVWWNCKLLEGLAIVLDVLVTGLWLQTTGSKRWIACVVPVTVFMLTPQNYLTLVFHRALRILVCKIVLPILYLRPIKVRSALNLVRIFDLELIALQVVLSCCILSFLHLSHFLTHFMLYPLFLIINLRQMQLTLRQLLVIDSPKPRFVDVMAFQPQRLVRGHIILALKLLLRIEVGVLFLHAAASIVVHL